MNPSFYLLWNALSIAFARKRYLRPGEPLPAPGPTAAFLARHGITEREAQIIRAVAERQSNKEIAYNLGLSANTVPHIRSVFLKAEVMSRVQLLNAFRQQAGG